MESIFKFKQFEVNQEGCAMRINTDGVLLGARSMQAHPLHILDIGTGTGVVAMMMAQRFPDSFVDAVEIDESAAFRAGKNFSLSAFSSRLRIFHTAIEAYDTEISYDLIVSNPPFFVNDLKNAEDRKSLARHADAAFFESVLHKAARMLSPGGLLWLILPVKQADIFIAEAIAQNLLLQFEISICSDQDKPVIRKLFALGRRPAVVKRETLFIYEAQGIHTAHYKQLLKEFFLAF